MDFTPSSLVPYAGSLALLLYLTSTVLLILRVRRGQTPGESSPLRSTALASASLALILHLLTLYGSLCCGMAGHMNLNVLNALSLVGWLSTLLILLASLRQPVENLELLIMPLTAFALALQLLIPSPSMAVRANLPGLDIHILVSLLAYSLLTLGALQAGLLAWQHNALHSRQPGGLTWRLLPPMESVERLMFQFIGVGFALLTLALLTGFVFLEDVFAQHLLHKTVLSMIAWLIFAGLLLGRFAWGWRGRTAVRWTTAGFVALLLAYFGTKIVLEWVLGIGLD
ncbi:MAG: cytochrome c biogenesis protein CcsA [Halothiobacillaceae bacterium]|jgi:ABC-type uncharacterized transport system permease subunit|nr:cytochrome c biogenesis protein CcsA [Halothiobacillaceae bacterium]MDY0049803.1 cytochrome c biogenesis protein CcsA [Halothiobacillaceae bacterium]